MTIVVKIEHKLFKKRIAISFRQLLALAAAAAMPKTPLLSMSRVYGNSFFGPLFRFSPEREAHVRVFRRHRHLNLIHWIMKLNFLITR